MVTPSVNGEQSARAAWGGRALLLLWGAIGVGALLLLAKSVQNSSAFDRLQPYILLLNITGVIALTILLARKLWQLVRDYRDHVPGSRLTARTVSIFGALVVAPLLIVYLFSLDFLNRGIDSWFKVEVKQGLSDALVLSGAALNLRMREYSGRTEQLARSLAGSPPGEIQERIDNERRATGAIEIVLFGEHERIIAASMENPLEPLPSRPPSDLVRQIRERRMYVSLEPQSDGQYFIRTAAPLSDSGANVDRGRAEGRYIVAIYQVPPQLSALSEAVQRSYSQYGELAALREALKSGFRLTLTLVLLLAMLAAIYGAIFFAQRLVRPVQDLIAGTRAVGKGDFGTRLPLPSRDEMGFLVHSFNDMTKRLRRAHEEATRSQQAVERERERLSIILARLSTGVLAVDRTLTVRMANQAAGAILGTDLSVATGRSLPELAAGNDRLGQFVAAVAVRFAAGRDEWREQLDLDGEAGRRTLMCACTPMPGEGSDMGYVIVFDDITTLLQAQRDAAWGEVARRLAHEIKNPLTPIQLSAERMRRRFLASMSPTDAEILDRSTRTIVSQVEAMQQMVNAFSEYARAPEMKITRFSLNQLVTEVADLYRSQDPRATILLDLDDNIEGIEADRGRIRQILNNLVTNALESLDGATAPTLEIASQLEYGGDASYAVVTVCDNGPGFQRELLGRVFDPYVTSKPKGTGLGLAIVKKIVEEHGGRIDADNRPEGGARVRVVLPVKDSTRSATGGPRRELRRERA
jgi:nitrogen fixation/metabolism regulation signal transduction histidine kinase